MHAPIPKSMASQCARHPPSWTVTVTSFLHWFVGAPQVSWRVQIQVPAPVSEVVLVYCVEPSVIADCDESTRVDGGAHVQVEEQPEGVDVLPSRVNKSPEATLRTFGPLHTAYTAHMCK